jgi:hypothetical protein
LAPGENSAPGGMEGERERGERLLHFAARGNKKERTTNTYCTLAAERKKKRKNRRDGERGEFLSGFKIFVFLFLSREEIDTHSTRVHYLVFFFSFFKKI